MTASWPALPYLPWQQTCTALHLYSQIVGKYRLARAPWVNHSWHATLYLNARGLTTSVIPDGPGGIEVAFDLLDHRLVGAATDGRVEGFNLVDMSVADFHARFLDLIRALGGTPRLNGKPNEVPDAVPFAEDVEPRPYDADAVGRYFQALVGIHAVFERFRTSYLGKVSPVHLFWGSFDLAVTRFSGREAPRHPGGVPGLPDAVTQEAYSHEVSSAGFWPGGGPITYPAFYAYAYPTPEGFAQRTVRPEAATFNTELGEFLLPYDHVRQAADPEAVLMTFLQDTYAAAADLGEWDRASLECETGEPLRPRPVS